MADMITFASAGGRVASSSAAYRPPAANWNVLLDYLAAAGLSEQQLQDVQSMLGDICFRDIDITILRMDGEQQDLTISCHLTTAGLKTKLGGEWTFQASSLQLTIGSRCLGDSDVIAEFVTSTERVLHAVVCASRAPQDRDELTVVNHKISAQLQNLSPYMDAGAHKHMMMLLEQSCQRARESCEAAACALARLSNGVVEMCMVDRSVKEIVKAAKREIRDAIVQRCQGWQLVNIFDFRRMVCVFQRLATDAGCSDNTVPQLMHGVRRFSNRRICGPAEPNILNAAGPNILNVADGLGCG